MLSIECSSGCSFRFETRRAARRAIPPSSMVTQETTKAPAQIHASMPIAIGMDAATENPISCDRVRARAEMRTV